MATATPTARSSRRLPVGALLLGLGFGGLADGIVLHQVLQWHHLVSDRTDAGTLEGLRSNVFWDGVFHVVTASLTALGIVLLLRAGLSTGIATGRAAAPLRRVLGLVLVGWGVFHLVDQAVFHLLLGLHDIRDDAERPELWNWGYTAIGAVLLASGAALARRS